MTNTHLARLAAAALLLSSTALAANAQDTAPAETPPAAAEPAAPAEPAPAQAEPVDPAAVVARVGGSEITEGDLAAALADLGPQFAQLPPEQGRIAVLAALIDIRSLSLEAQEAGLENDPLVERRIAFLRDRALHNAYFEQEGVEAITDEELRTRYDTEIAAMAPAEPTEEVNARHILVATREEAEAIIDELDGGADFAELATERSSDPGSGQRGGDLGWFGPGQMVPAFETAAFALEPGSYTQEPVESQFGWHVIQTTEKRTAEPAEPPAFEDVSEQVRQVVLRERYIEIVRAAREELDVEYVDPQIQSQIEAMEAAMEGEPAAGEQAPAAGETPPAQ